MAVLIETNIGDLVVDLKVDEAPKACLNFLKLCKVKYYHNCLFHNVQKNFIAQTGDPTNTGKGGSSVHAKLPGLAKRYFEDEITPALKHNVRGTVGMANLAPNQNGSQFYITLRDKVEHLDGKHTIFGVIAEGLDVLQKMNDTMLDEKDAPYQNIRIRHTEILEDPFDDPAGLDKVIPPKSPELIEDNDFKKIEDEQDEQELQETMAKTLAKSQATTLELLHDLPDADIAPPDNDLFIYKLNPVTQDGDLEIIFSRFGPIKSCEIVRDWKTGDSLQYAFVIFENARDCENAYFKMHDCVIDDRRIGVNFSQSVAKMWNKWRTGGRITKEDFNDSDAAKGRGKGRGKGKGKKGKGGDAEIPSAPVAVSGLESAAAQSQHRGGDSHTSQSGGGRSDVDRRRHEQHRGSVRDDDADRRHDNGKKRRSRSRRGGHDNGRRLSRSRSKHQGRSRGSRH